MRFCVNCKNELQPNQQIYNVIDLSTDIVKVLEETIGREAKVHDCLCSYCYSTVIQPSEEDGSIILAELQDPLLEPPEIQVKKSPSSEGDDESGEEEELDPEPIVKLQNKIKKTTDSSEEEEHDPESMVNLHQLQRNSKEKKSTDSSEEDEENDSEPAVNLNLKSKICIVCSEALNEHQIISLPLGPERDAVENHIYPKKLSRHSVICKDCLQTTMETKRSTEESPVKNDTIESSKSIVHNQETEFTFIHIPNYFRAGGSSRRCFVKDCQNDEPCRKVVPKYMRRILLESFNVFLSPAARSCSTHRKEYYRDWSHLRDKKLYKQKFNSQQVEEMLEVLRNDP